MQVRVLNGRGTKTLGSWQQHFSGTVHVQGSRDAYAQVPLVRRCVELRCDALAGVPYQLQRDGEAIQWHFPQQLESLLWVLEAHLLIFGRAYLLKLVNPFGIPKGLQVLHPQTMESEVVDVVAGVPRFRHTQRIDGKVHATYDDDALLYLREFAAGNDVGGGGSVVDTCLGAAQVQAFMTAFAVDYFENGVMPTTLLMFPNNTQPTEREKVEQWFRRRVTGFGRRMARVLALGGAVQVHTLTPELRNLAMPQLAKYTREQVALAFKIPQTMLDSAANYATAREHRRSFMDETIRPRLRWYAAQLNEGLFAPMGLELRFMPEELPIYQPNEAERASALERLRAAGMPLPAALSVLGYQVPPELLKSTPEPTGKAMQADLEAWRRKAKNRLQQGKSLDFPFASDAIPPTLQATIRTELAKAENREAVDAIFANMG